MLQVTSDPHDGSVQAPPLGWCWDEKRALQVWRSHARPQGGAGRSLLRLVSGIDLVKVLTWAAPAAPPQTTQKRRLVLAAPTALTDSPQVFVLHLQMKPHVWAVSRGGMLRSRLEPPGEPMEPEGSRRGSPDPKTFHFWILHPFNNSWGILTNVYNINFLKNQQTTVVNSHKSMKKSKQLYMWRIQNPKGSDPFLKFC